MLPVVATCRRYILRPSSSLLRAMNPAPIVVIILAAGEGTRMKSSRAKVLHGFAGRSMLQHVLRAIEPLQAERTIVVVGPGMEAVSYEASAQQSVVQRERLGTGHAVACVRDSVADLLATEHPGSAGRFDVLVVYGDTPLLRSETLARMAARRGKDPAAAPLVGLAFEAIDPSPYGRVITNATGHVMRVVEARDADKKEQAITLCNAGLLFADGHRLFEWVARLSNDNAKGEYYLTDLFAMAASDAVPAILEQASEQEVMGVNDRHELAKAAAVMQDRLRRDAMEQGVTLVDPASVWLSWDTSFGQDVVVEPNVTFGPGVQVAEGAEIRSFSHLEGARVGPGARIGPYARLRPGTVIEAKARVGNFVEIKNSRSGRGCQGKSLELHRRCYRSVPSANIGAGTITCNYDGLRQGEDRNRMLALSLASNTALGGAGDGRQASHGGGGKYQYGEAVAD